MSLSLPESFHQPDKHRSSDHVFKTAYGVDVSLRVWPGPQDGERRPWLFWIHGGGFSAGYAERVVPWIHAAFLPRYHIVSVGYRLSPQVSFNDQLEDLHDAWAWCGSHLPQIIGAEHIDVSRAIIGGESAGACFALRTAFTFQPAPKVIVDLYGPVLVSDPHFHVAPSDVEEQLSKIQYCVPRTEAELEAALFARDPAQAKTIFPWWFELDLPQERLAAYLGRPGYAVGDAERLRMDLYKYMGARRCRFATVFRKSEFETDEAYQAHLNGHSSLLLLDHAETFPPTFVLHGTGDSAVPIRQSREFVDKLKRKGVPCDARFPEGLEHSFDAFIQEGDELWQECIVPCLKFVEAHV